MIGNWSQRFTLTALVMAALGCRPEQPTTQSPGGTARMADTLATLIAQALANPSANPFLSRQRADLFQAEIAGRTGTDAFGLRYQLIHERLRAGQTREAIEEAHRLLRDAGLSPDNITRQGKPVFDLLALAYLRLGEQENCLENPAANVCILPLDSARHTRQEGAREAIARYRRLLETFPDDYGSRWLANLAAMALGGYPDSLPPAILIPNLAPRANDPFPRFPNIAGDVGAQVAGLAGGLVVDDLNGDGLLDVFTTSWGLEDPVHLLLADGRGRFADRTADSDLAGIVGGLNAVSADYDNDGDVDILVLRGAWLGAAGGFPNSLLRNRGDGTFEDVTFAAGLLSFHPTQVGAWADFDLDGDLDLFVGNESGLAEGGPSHPSELFLNNGDGTFTEVARRVGLVLDEFVKGAVWGDVNNDGLPDLFASILGGRNRLFLNRGGSATGWRFEERAAAAGVELPIASFPTWFWDYDQDGWEDLLVLSYDIRSPLSEMVSREYLGLPLERARRGSTVGVEPSRLFRNNGDGTFSDATERVGLADKAIFAMGSNFGDLDNDGWLDVYVGTGNPDLRSVIPNRMFRNVRGRRFEEVTLPAGVGHLQKGHGAAFADFDRDGDQDVYMVLGGAYQGDRFATVLFENPGWPAASWMALTLEGRTANRSAIGARVEALVIDSKGATRTVRRTVGTGGSFGAGSLQLHLGLGPAVRVQEVTIRWPDAARTTTTHRDLAVNRFYRVIQGQEPVALEWPLVPFRKVPLGRHPGDHHPDAKAPPPAITPATPDSR
ncbi:MAG: FG-GAP-like repeat-containing protein [Gemmatimonadales bacterium]